MKKLKYLVLHCTATPEGREVTRSEIVKWHTAEPPIGRGWKVVGYSKIIHLDGCVTNLREYNDDPWIQSGEITNGVKGINSVSRHFVYSGGIAASGGKPKDTRTPEQLAVMEALVKKEIKNNPELLVAGHNQFSNKACPSFDVPNWLRAIGVSEGNIYQP